MSDVSALPDFDSVKFLLEIQTTCTSMFATLTFRLYTQKLELEGLNQRPNFVTIFVDPVENIEILIASGISFSMNLIRLDTLVSFAWSHPIKWDSGVTTGFPFKTIKF